MQKKLPTISNEYKKQVTNSIFFIILFFLVYILLIALSLAFLVFIGYLIVQIVLAIKFSYITIIISGGLIGMAFFILVFLVKFIFNFQSNDTSGFIEIKRDKEPEFFKLIDDVVTEVETNHPKKVFLSSDVNAFVNYNSTFWSMFFPVKKNLTVGLGLINTTTVSELKAILAHEFGHFSQSSMKVGSYVNQANKIIYDMLYNNKGFDDMLKSFAGLNGILQIFAIFALWFIKGIQWILSKFYDILFKKHMSLSRQMEFNADAIATYLVGSDVNSASLLRLDLSEAAIDNSIRFYLDKSINFDTKNLYKNQATLLQFLAEENNHRIENKLPYININELDRYNKSKLHIENQWASHPTIKQRIEAIKKLNKPSLNIDSRLATNLLRNFDQYAENFTDRIFELNMISHTGNFISEELFITKYKEINEKNTFPKIFNSYYDTKNPTVENLNKIKNDLLFEDFQGKSSDELFSDEKLALILEKIALESDKNVLEMIKDGSYNLKTFDYDGVKYNKRQTSTPRKIIENRLKIVDDEIAKNDELIFKTVYSKANSEEKLKLSELQEKFNSADKEFDEYYNAFNEFIPHLSFMSESLQIDDIRRYRKILLDKEVLFKQNIEKLLNFSPFRRYFENDNKVILTNYLAESFMYFENSSYNQDEINQLDEVLGNYQQAMSKAYFNMKKELLSFYREFLEKN